MFPTRNATDWQCSPRSFDLADSKQIVRWDAYYHMQMRNNGSIPVMVIVAPVSIHTCSDADARLMSTQPEGSSALYAGSGHLHFGTISTDELRISSTSSQQLKLCVPELVAVKSHRSVRQKAQERRHEASQEVVLQIEIQQRGIAEDVRVDLT